MNHLGDNITVFASTAAKIYVRHFQGFRKIENTSKNFVVSLNE